MTSDVAPDQSFADGTGRIIASRYAWIYTTHQPHIGVLDCHVCGNGGVDFHHAYRHVGVDEDR